MEGKVSEKKKIVQKRSAHLTDSLPATLYCSFLGPGEIPDSTDLLYKLYREMKILPFQADTF